MSDLKARIVLYYTRVDWWLYRIRVRWRMWRNSAQDLNNRVDVERVLINVALGKRQPLTPEECRALANKLGTYAT